MRVHRFAPRGTAGPEGADRRSEGLLSRWNLPLDIEERATASLVGAARHNEELRSALDTALVTPLAAARSCRSSGEVQRSTRPIRSPRSEPVSSGTETGVNPLTACRARAAIEGQRR